MTLTRCCRRRFGGDHADLRQQPGDVRLLQPEGAQRHAATIHPHQLGEWWVEASAAPSREALYCGSLCWRPAVQPRIHFSRLLLLKVTLGVVSVSDGEQHCGLLRGAAAPPSSRCLLRRRSSRRPGVTDMFVVSGFVCKRCAIVRALNEP